MLLFFMSFLVRGNATKRETCDTLVKNIEIQNKSIKGRFKKIPFFSLLELVFRPPPPVQSRRKKSDPCLVVVKTLFGTILLRAMHFFFSFSLLNETQIQSHQAGSPPPPLTIRAFIFIARSLEIFLPSSTRIEWRLPTLQGALSGLFL